MRSLNCPPGRLVAFLEVLGRTVWVNVVAQGEDRALHATDEPGGCLVAITGAVGDVARRDDDLPVRRSREPLRSATNGEETPQEGYEDHRSEPLPPDARRRTKQERGHR